MLGVAQWKMLTPCMLALDSRAVGCKSKDSLTLSLYEPNYMYDSCYRMENICKCISTQGLNMWRLHSRNVVLFVIASRFW